MRDGPVVLRATHMPYVAMFSTFGAIQNLLLAARAEGARLGQHPKEAEAEAVQGIPDPV